MISLTHGRTERWVDTKLGRALDDPVAPQHLSVRQLRGYSQHVSVVRNVIKRESEGLM
jgi:hypothetical protein